MAVPTHCPKGCDLRGKEIPAEQRASYGGTTHFLDGLFGVEVQGVYDGALYWVCGKCGEKFHRWPEGDPLRQLADPYVRSA